MMIDRAGYEGIKSSAHMLSIRVAGERMSLHQTESATMTISDTKMIRQCVE